MRTLKFGISLPKGQEDAAFAAEAEELGFDYVSCGEHLAFHGPTTNAFINLAAAAATTTRIELLSSVTIVPLYPPALLAKLVAALDYLSKGRFNLGVGVGGEFPAEFAAVGVPLTERGARTDESLEIVHRLLTENNVRFAGRFHRIDSLTINPKPVRSPRPPIWIAGRSQAAMRRAARFGDAWFPYLYDPRRYASSVDSVRRFAAEEGRVWQGTNAYFAFVTAYPDERRARATITEGVGRAYRQDFSSMSDKYLIAGSPDTCRRRIEDYIEAGATTIVLRLMAPAADFGPMMRMVAADVVGPLRDEPKAAL